ncbi:hypothetical protein UPYG_G00353170 [Umbra pygmaea]|uniref:Transposase n=1 Tax=Umbra pygmaea TaxID=75934 RepID=A0ABD0VVY1_UMBPY
MSNIEKFWDHIRVACHAPDTEQMFSANKQLPKLFGVDMTVDEINECEFYWNGFVLKDQIILAMWVGIRLPRGGVKVFILVDDEIKPLATSLAFRNMTYWLATWFTAHYGLWDRRELKLVLDCKPSESKTIVNFMHLLASKCGM